MDDHPEGGDSRFNPLPAAPALVRVLRAAAELQRLVPGAVLVGGTAAAYHAQRRHSQDDDHVVEDLEARFDTVLDNLEALADWSTARVAPGRLILGELGGIETGVRQLRRVRPLETETISIDGHDLVVPTITETLRVKGWLVVDRNQTRDHLDVAALADMMGWDEAGSVLAGMDDYYQDVYAKHPPATQQLIRQLSDPRPRDPTTTEQLAHYKGLDERWHDWAHVCEVLAEVALRVRPSRR